MQKTSDQNKQPWNDKRRSYWNEKYASPSWDEDIHFALMPDGEVTEERFREGIRFNTTKVFHEVHELASIYSLSKNFCVLDFGCGAGDLLLKMASEMHNFLGVGIDIADNAIDRATGRLKGDMCENSSKIEFYRGSTERLSHLQEKGLIFDLIICRDIFYLLDEEEQDFLLGGFSTLLRSAGILYIADLAVEEKVESDINRLIIRRQFGGRAIRWAKANSGQITFSLEGQAKRNGFKFIDQPSLEADAVEKSYTAAANYLADDPSLAAVYREIATVAGNGAPGADGHRVPYARFFLRPDRNVLIQPENSESKTGSFIGFKFGRDFKFGHRTIFADGSQWILPAGKWSLIIGRSGIGKSTFLKLMAGWLQVRHSLQIGVNEGKACSVFLLDQEPVLVNDLTVRHNIELFCAHWGRINHIYEALGFDERILSRKANSQLSGGERQRVALGQAVAAMPDLLLLDEPCTGVDHARKRQFFVMLRKLCADTPSQTVVCVDHDFVSIENFFDHVFEVLDGRLLVVR